LEVLGQNLGEGFDRDAGNRSAGDRALELLLGIGTGLLHKALKMPAPCRLDK
jgi:hypothetical protein